MSIHSRRATRTFAGGFGRCSAIASKRRKGSVLGFDTLPEVHVGEEVERWETDKDHCASFGNLITVLQLHFRPFHLYFADCTYCKKEGRKC